MLRQAVVLVGDLGARPDAPPGDRTATTSMLNIAGRPFLDTLIDEIMRYDAFEEILRWPTFRPSPFWLATPA